MRYEHKEPGGLIHHDIKKPGRFEWVGHRITPSGRLRAIACRAMDNGPCYKAKTFAAACKALSFKHIRAKPHTPKTNEKAERFLQTALREWACARATSDRRKTHLPEWTHMCNLYRPHGNLNSKPHLSRLGRPMDNLLRCYS